MNIKTIWILAYDCNETGAVMLEEFDSEQEMWEHIIDIAFYEVDDEYKHSQQLLSKGEFEHLNSLVLDYGDLSFQYTHKEVAGHAFNVGQRQVPRVEIWLEGGLIQTAYADQPVKVEVLTTDYPDFAEQAAIEQVDLAREKLEEIQNSEAFESIEVIYG